MAESTNKVVTVESLATFKTQIETVVDTKVAASGGSIAYATEQDILALFTDSSESAGA